MRNLADILEYCKPKIKTLISKKDEKDLFNIANNFGIRHLNEKQKTDYDHSLSSNIFLASSKNLLIGKSVLS